MYALPQHPRFLIGNHEQGENEKKIGETAQDKTTASEMPPCFFQRRGCLDMQSPRPSRQLVVTKLTCCHGRRVLLFGGCNQLES